MEFYQLDFDQVAEAGFRSKHRPTFPADQLRRALDPALRHERLVRQYERHHHGTWYLPLVEAHVRSFLKQVIFTQPPAVQVGGAEVVCSRPADPPAPAKVEAWVQHFGSGYFPSPYLRKRLAELEEGPLEAFGKEAYERPAQILAIRQLLAEPDG